MKRRSIAAAVGALRLPADVDTAQFIREVERIAAITRESLGLEIERHRRLAQPTRIEACWPHRKIRGTTRQRSSRH
jgi:hypothetical protein